MSVELDSSHVAQFVIDWSTCTTQIMLTLMEVELLILGLLFMFSEDCQA